MVQVIDCMNQEEFNNAIIQISGNNPELKEVKFSGLSGDINKINRLSDAIKINSTLTSIDLSSNGLGETGAAILAEALKANSKLTRIALDYNRIDVAGAASIAEALKENTALTRVSLSGCAIKKEGAKKLAEALKVNRALTGIELSDNNIGDAGAASIAEALKENRYLTSINLSGNQIKDIGTESIAEALKVNTTLTGIDLSYNEMRYTGAESIAEALKVNATLTEINLEWNYIYNEGVERLAEALEVNRTLTSMVFSDPDGVEVDDPMDEAGEANIAEALEANYVITTLELFEERHYIVTRNRQFLSQAVADSKEGRALTAEQQQTLLAHLSSDKTELFPINERKRFIENNEALFRERMVNITQDNKFEDPARNIAEFIGSIKDINNFNQRTSSDNKLQAVASRGDLGPALRLSNNRIFIDDALKNGMSSSQIQDNLNRVISDTNAHDYALTNPKQLGYLITLDKVQLDRAIEIINHKTLGKIVKEKPEQIAKLVKDLSISWSNTSSNLDPLLSASNAVKNRLRESDAETNEPKKKPRSH